MQEAQGSINPELIFDLRPRYQGLWHSCRHSAVRMEAENNIRSKQQWLDFMDANGDKCFYIFFSELFDISRHEFTSDPNKDAKDLIKEIGEWRTMVKDLNRKKGYKQALIDQGIELFNRYEGHLLRRSLVGGQ